MVVTIVVEGQEYAIDLEKELGISESMEVDRSEVAAKVGFWGAVWAGAQFEVDIHDLSYRNWRAASMVDTVNSVDRSTGKPMTQYKTEWTVEATPEFREMKTRIAEAALVACKAKVIYEAYNHKAQILARLALRDRLESGTSGEIGHGYDDEDRQAGPPSARSKKVGAVEQVFRRTALGAE